MPVVGDVVRSDPDERPEEAPRTDALPNTEERAMGGNPANPDVNVLADVKGEGLDPEHANDQTAVTQEGAAAASVAAQNALQIYENQLAILKADNAKLIERDEATTSKMKELYNLLEAPDGENVEDRVKAMKAKAKADEERIGALQIALGIGPQDDPEKAAGALKSRNRLADVDPTTTLPAYGHLLLMTSLARISPLTRGQYNTVPNVIKTPQGDTWTSRVEETLGEDGQPIRNVVIRVDPGAYDYAEARNRKLKLDGDLAVALRGQKDAERRLGVNPATQGSDIRKAVDQQAKDAAKRVEEIKAELAIVEPKTVQPEPKEWRFNADLDGYALKGAA